MEELMKESALLVCLDTGEYDSAASLLELSELADTAGVEVIATKTQKREHPEVATFVGSGMVEEIKEYCVNNEIELIIFDSELSPVQIRNLEAITDIRVIDRTMLILDIFANSAKTKAGKLQVELAQLKYMLPRLTGKGIALSRLGGGVGTRGPGETKLETDRRHIRRRIDNIKEDLKEVEKNRFETERKRKKDGAITVALLGYTNAGKSTLMNKLTDAGVLAQDKLFATLDPTIRALKLPSGKNVMLIDTVGFIRRLPHRLVESFKSTLDQAANADIILNICDSSNPEATEHLEVTTKILADLSRDEHSIIPVMNKCDKANLEDMVRVPNAVRISAATGEGLDKLLEAIEELLPHKNVKAKILFPFTKAYMTAQIREDGIVMSEDYQEDGVLVEALVEYTLFEKIKKDSDIKLLL